MKTVGVGNEFFHDFIENDSYYVDKTELLYELVEKTDTQVTLFIGLHQILVLSGENLVGIPVHTGCSETA